MGNLDLYSTSRGGRCDIIVKDSTQYAIRCLLALGAMGAMAALLVFCGVLPFCTNTELEQTLSPDGRWRATVNLHICNSTFSGPFKSVLLRATSGPTPRFEEQKVVEYEADEIVAIRWVEFDLLEIMLPSAVQTIVKKQQMYGRVRIQYVMLPVRR